MQTITLKTTEGQEFFEYTCENNTIRKTIVFAIDNKIDLSWTDLSHADLSYMDLHGINLSYSNLRGTNLRWTNLQGTDLSHANLSYANLNKANLYNANLNATDLRYADLDFSCITLSRSSRKAITDIKQRIQLCNHLLSWIKEAEQTSTIKQKIFNLAKKYANAFHRLDVEKF